MVDIDKRMIIITSCYRCPYSKSDENNRFQCEHMDFREDTSIPLDVYFGWKIKENCDLKRVIE